MNKQIEGYDELVKLMDKMPDALQRRTVLQIFRRSVKPIVASAKSKLKSYTGNYGQLAKAVGTWNGKSRKNPNLFVGPRVKGKWQSVGYMAHWVEYGTSGIKSKNTGTRSWKKTEENERFAVLVGGINKGERYRQDQAPKPFMRPAIDQNIGIVKSNIEKEFAEQIKRIIQKNLKKLSA